MDTAANNQKSTTTSRPWGTLSRFGHLLVTATTPQVRFINYLILLVRDTGFEPVTFGFGVQTSHFFPMSTITRFSCIHNYQCVTDCHIISRHSKSSSAIFVLSRQCRAGFPGTARRTWVFCGAVSRDTLQTRPLHLLRNILSYRTGERRPCAGRALAAPRPNLS